MESEHHHHEHHGHHEHHEHHHHHLIEGEFLRDYALYAEPMGIQGAVQIYALTDARNKLRVIETGSGTGLANRVFATNFLCKGGVYVTTDVDPNMNALAATAWERSDFSKDPANKIAHLNTELPKEGKPPAQVDLEAEIAKLGDFNKAVLTAPADNEALPFPDESFDVYLACFCLHHVSNQEKMVREAYRVLKKGGVLGIVEFGRKENMWIFSVFEELMTEPPKNPHGDMHAKVARERVMQMCRDSGFAVVKCKYVDSLFPEYSDDKSLMASLSFGAQASFYLKGKDEEEQEKLKKAAFERYKERFGPETGEMPFVEISLYYAKK